MSTSGLQAIQHLSTLNYKIKDMQKHTSFKKTCKLYDEVNFKTNKETKTDTLLYLLKIFITIKLLFYSTNNRF